MSRIKTLLPQGGWPVGQRAIFSGTSMRKTQPEPFKAGMLEMDYTAIETRVEALFASGVEIKQDEPTVLLDVTAIRTARLRGPKSHF